MRKFVFLFIGTLCLLTLFAQKELYIHQPDKTTTAIQVSTIDSLKFVEDETILNIYKKDNTVTSLLLSSIDSISFGDVADTVTITYSGSSVSVNNPLASSGVTITTNGADVVVNASAVDCNYILKGSATDGSFKVYSAYKFDLILSGVSITNSDGPAINIQSGKKCAVILGAGTTNFLTDGSSYATSSEDQKGAFFSEGQLEFQGTGALTVNGKSKHGICSDDYVDITGGNITIASAKKDGIHSNDYFAMSGGVVNVSATGDGIECEGGYVRISGGNLLVTNTVVDVSGIKCDSTMTISGGTLGVTVGGNQSKGLKAGSRMILSGGNITVNTSGAAVLAASGSGFDPSYCTAVKCDSAIVVSGSSIAITSNGAGGKGISTDIGFMMTSGVLTITCSGTGATYTNSTGVKDSYNATCITSDGAISILGGTVTLSTSSAANGGKGLSSNGSITFGEANNSPTINITTLGAKFLVSGSDYCHPKTVVADGSVTINNGIMTLSSSDDGIHSETSVTQNGGDLTITNSYEGVEGPYIYLNGGTMSVTATNDAINATKGTVSGGTESNDGSCFYINGGTLFASCSNGDAIDSNGSVVMSGGVAIVYGPTTSPEEAADFNGKFTMKGGFFVGAGSNSNMNKTMDAATSTQRNLYILSGSQLSASTLFHIQDAGGNNIVTFKPVRAYYSVLFSSSELKTGVTYSIYTGGSCTGVLSNGLYTGGTYSGGTFRKNFTLSSSSTVTSVSF